VIAEAGFPLLMMGGFAAVIGIGFYFGAVAERKRNAAMQMVAQTMGFQFTETCDGMRLANLAGALPVFDKGHGRKAVRLCEGELAGRKTAILDYRYTTGGGKSSHTHRQTIVLFPDFTLDPENVLHRIAGVFGYQDIDFPDYPDFSTHYLLRGSDETAIRAAFNSNVLAFLGGTTGWHVQAQSGSLAVFKEGAWAKPEEIPTHAADALRIAGAFKTA